MQKEVSNTFIEQPLNIKEISTNFIKMCRNVMDLTQKIADCVPIIINNLNELATKAISTFQVLNEYSALTNQAF